MSVILSVCHTFCASGQMLENRFINPLEGIIWGKPEPIFQEDTLTIRFVGDIMMHEKQIINARNKDNTYTFRGYFDLISDLIEKADIAVGNMEFSLGGKPYSGYPCFSAPDEYGTCMADYGFDVFLTANNHLLDRGSKGALRTISKYHELGESHGIQFTGSAKDKAERDSNNPLIITAKDIKIAIINFSYGSNLGTQTEWPKMNLMSERKLISSAIQKAEDEEVDCIIAAPHWGTEYVLKHSNEQQQMAQWLVSQGVDVIIGTHPHVVQDYAEIEGVPVVYSLGNAVSNMSATNTQMELMATLRIVRRLNGTTEILPLELTYLWCSLPGGFNDCYIVVPVKEYLDKKHEWKGANDYEKMISTYSRVKRTTGVPDGYVE